MANGGGTGISIGNFDLGLEVVENRIQLMVMNKIINHLLTHSSADITQQQIDEMRREAVEELNREYPELGIEHQ